MNDGFFNPKEGVLLVSAAAEDIGVERDEDGRVTIAFMNFFGGIEIVDDDDRLWRPA